MRRSSRTGWSWAPSGPSLHYQHRRHLLTHQAQEGGGQATDWTTTRPTPSSIHEPRGGQPWPTPTSPSPAT